MLNKKNKAQQEYGQDVQNGHYVGPMPEGQGGCSSYEQAIQNEINAGMQQQQMQQPQQNYFNNGFSNAPYHDEPRAYKKRSSSPMKSMVIVMTLSLGIGFVGGLIMAPKFGLNPDVAQEVEATLTSEKDKMQKQLEGVQALGAQLNAWQLAFSKDEALSVLDSKINKLNQNINQAKANVGADSSIKALNPKLYSELLQAIEEDGQRQYATLKQARDILAGSVMSAAQGQAGDDSVSQAQPQAQTPAHQDTASMQPQVQPEMQQQLQTQTEQLPQPQAEVLEENMLEYDIFSTPSIAEQGEEMNPQAPATQNMQQPQQSPAPQAENKEEDEIPF